MSEKTCKLPKRQHEKAICAFDPLIECDVEDQDNPKCRLVGIRPVFKSATHGVHSEMQRRTSDKIPRSTSVDDRESSYDQDLDENPDEIEELDESDGEFVEDDDELDENASKDETSDEDEETDEEEDEEDEDTEEEE